MSSQAAINGPPHHESDHPAVEGSGYGFKKTAAVIWWVQSEILEKGFVFLKGELFSLFGILLVACEKAIFALNFLFSLLVAAINTVS